jgi:hypothetical protein
MIPTGSGLAHWPRNPFYWHTNVSSSKGSPSLSTVGTLQEHEKQQKQGHYQHWVTTNVPIDGRSEIFQSKFLDKATT